jgi:MFS superfamily sulfate permease-like transporter
VDSALRGTLIYVVNFLTHTYAHTHTHTQHTHTQHTHTHVSRSFEDVDGNYVTGTVGFYTALLCLIGFAVTMLMPYLTTFVPSALVAIAVTTFIEQIAGMGTKTVGDMGKMGGNFPPLAAPDMEYTSAAFFRCLLAGVIYGSVGLVESVMTLQVLDDITETRGSQSREAFAQGLGNFVAGWFGTMGGSPMIGQSVINTSSGGTRRLSGTWASILLLVIILAASSVIEMVPTGGLAGVMLSIVIKTFDWSSIPMILLRRVPVATDGVVIVLVTVTTVVVNLAAAVGIGIAYTALVFAWEMRNKVEVESHLETDSWGNVAKVYTLRGRLMFSSAPVLLDLFHAITEDPTDVILDLRHAIVHDYSGAEALDHLAAKYAGHDRRVHVRNVPAESRRMWDRARVSLTNIVDDDDARTGAREHRPERYIVSVEPKLVAAKPETLLCDTCGGAIRGGELRLGRVVRNAELGINTVIYYHFHKIRGDGDCLVGHHVLPQGKTALEGLKALPRKLRKDAAARAEQLRRRVGSGIGRHRWETPGEGATGKPVKSDFSSPNASSRGRPRRRKGRGGAAKAAVADAKHPPAAAKSAKSAPGGGGVTFAAMSQRLAAAPGSDSDDTSGFQSSGSSGSASYDEYTSYSSEARSDHGAGGIQVGDHRIASHAEGWAAHTNPTRRLVTSPAMAAAERTPSVSQVTAVTGSVLGVLGEGSPAAAATSSDTQRLVPAVSPADVAAGLAASASAPAPHQAQPSAHSHQPGAVDDNDEKYVYDDFHSL